MTSAADQRNGLRGRDKQQDDLQNHNSGQAITRDQRGQEQPADRERARRASGRKMQEDAGQSQPQSPGQPAGGE